MLPAAKFSSETSWQHKLKGNSQFWTPEDDELLKFLRNDLSIPHWATGRLLGRTDQASRSRVDQLGLPRNEKRCFIPRDIYALVGIEWIMVDCKDGFRKVRKRIKLVD